MKKKIIFSRLARIFSRLARIPGVRSYNHRILFGLILIIFLSLSACRSSSRLTVTTPELHTIHTNTNNTELLWRDRYRYIQTIGDTVHVTDSIFVILYKDSVRTVLQRDSVPYPVEVPVTVFEDPAPGWHRFTTWFFIITVFLLLLRIITAIYLRR